MQNNFYTFLIIPQKKKAVKKITASSRFLKSLLVFSGVVLLFGLYFAFDYVSIKRETAEVRSLRVLADNQRTQLDELSGKIGQFEQKMAELQQIDSNVRLLAQDVTKKTRVALKPSTGRDPSSPLGVGGSPPDEGFGTTRLEAMNRHVDRLLEDATHQEQSFNELLDFLKKQKSILAFTPSIWPVQGWVTSEFGYRKSPFTGRKEFHKGMDIATKLGKEIIAPADGIVTTVERESGMGNSITINHSNGISTSYAHLLKSVVRKGQVVRRGDIIGFVGSSGRSTGPHLHYAVLLNGVPVNPRKYLP